MAELSGVPSLVVKELFDDCDGPTPNVADILTGKVPFPLPPTLFAEPRKLLSPKALKTDEIGYI